jgi:hypothetical protein
MLAGTEKQAMKAAMKSCREALAISEPIARRETRTTIRKKIHQIDVRRNLQRRNTPPDAAGQSVERILKGVCRSLWKKRKRNRR